MAVTKITPLSAGFNAASTAIAFTAATVAADGVEIPFTGKDHKILLLIQNTDDTNAEAVTIKKGDGIGAVADLALSVAKSEIVSLVVDSSAYKQSDGTLFLVPASTDTKFAAVILP